MSACGAGRFGGAGEVSLSEAEPTGGRGCSLGVVAWHTRTRTGHSGGQKSRFATCHRYSHPKSGRILDAMQRQLTANIPER